MSPRALPSLLAAAVLAMALPARAELVSVTRSVGAAPVLAVPSTRVADLVILGAGFGANLRPGMHCRVTRGSTDIAEILLVELRPAASAALILSCAAGQSIRPGDLATVIAFKS